MLIIEIPMRDIATGAIHQSCVLRRLLAASLPVTKFWTRIFAAKKVPGTIANPMKISAPQVFGSLVMKNLLKQPFFSAPDHTPYSSDNDRYKRPDHRTDLSFEKGV